MTVPTHALTLRRQLRQYLGIWLALLALLTLSVSGNFWPLGALKPLVNFGIAAAKAALVLAVFMQLRHAGTLTRLFAAASFVWLGMLGGLALMDNLTRI